MKYYSNSENSIIILFAENPSQKLTQKIISVHHIIKQDLKKHYLDGVASYDSLTIFYHLSLTVKQALNYIKNSLEKPIKISNIVGKIYEIPAFYDKSVALDLSNILAEKNLTKDEFIQCHSQKNYLVYSIGFMPNFAYLGMLDDKLCTPRHKTPRKHIPIGSIGIADCQTGIYPADSPAGWQIIGRTPIDLTNNPQYQFKVGDQIKFIPIDKKNYDSF